MGGIKLKTIHVIIIGSLACVVIVAGLYFLVIKKSCEQITVLKADLQKNEQIWNQKASVEAKLETAKQNYRIAQAKYEKYAKDKMPSISFAKREEGMIALWKEQTEILGPLLQSWPNKTGVILKSGVSVASPPINPNAAVISNSPIILKIGDFEVTGDFSDILNHIRSWNKFKRLVMIGPLSLTGPSPGMTGRYSVTVYIFPRGETGAAVAMAGGASASTR